MKKSALFAGGDDGTRIWARCTSLIGTYKRNNVNPQVYLTDTLRRILGVEALQAQVLPPVRQNRDGHLA